jgi:XTP/dITP diphosphohydrolase
VVLLVASTNPGKINEIRKILADLPLTIRTLADVPPIPEPEETGATFADNAALKALAYAEASGLPTVAEDSGLAIDALLGRPGVLSARYPGRNYAERFANLYRELAPHPRPWTARFVCSLAFAEPRTAASPARIVFTDEATVEGEIATIPSGTNGFGYDPIFFYPPYGATLADVDDEMKLAVAHRGKAFRAFRRWIAGRRPTGSAS